MSAKAPCSCISPTRLPQKTKDAAAAFEGYCLQSYDYAWNSRQNGSCVALHLKHRCCCCCAHTVCCPLPRILSLIADWPWPSVCFQALPTRHPVTSNQLLEAVSASPTPRPPPTPSLGLQVASRSNLGDIRSNKA